MAVANTLVYNNTVTIKAVKIFIVQAPGQAKKIVSEQFDHCPV
jgi:hypothetical protein